MPSLVTHNKQAKHNEKLAKSLKGSVFIDWVITCAFYAALHYVEAAFANIPEILGSEESYAKHYEDIQENKPNMTIHAYREFLASNKFPKIRLEYAQLRVASEASRYLEKTKDTPAFSFFDKNTSDKMLGYLSVIQSETQRFLKKS